jgi:NADPH2:quinone reductase
MKAILVRQAGGPDVLKLEDVPDPVPGAGQVLVRVHAAGVNPVDTYLRSGTQGRTPALPYVPGTDGAGIIEALGPDAAGASVGDRIYFSGTSSIGYTGAYAQKAVCHLAQVHTLPRRLSCAQGAAIGVPYATAYRALVDRAAARPAETVLVHGGSGGVGIAAIQLARAAGMTVVATAGTERGLALATQHGAHVAISHAAPGYIDQIMAATLRRGVDVIIEMLANVNLDRDLGLLAVRGRVVVVGNRGRVEIDARQTMGKDAAILGMMLGNATPADVARIHAALGAGFENGTLTPVVGREFPLADAPQAHAAVLQPGALGKIVLIP